MEELWHKKMVKEKPLLKLKQRKRPMRKRLPVIMKMLSQLLIAVIHQKTEPLKNARRKKHKVFHIVLITLSLALLKLRKRKRKKKRAMRRKKREKKRRPLFLKLEM